MAANLIRKLMYTYVTYLNHADNLLKFANKNFDRIYAKVEI